jgi:hypothetical protein
VFRDSGLQTPVAGSIAQLRDEPDWALLFILADKSAHLARRESQPRGNRGLLEMSVDKSLNALEPIQFAHRHGHLGYPDHGQSPRP